MIEDLSSNSISFWAIITTRLFLIFWLSALISTQAILLAHRWTALAQRYRNYHWALSSPWAAANNSWTCSAVRTLRLQTLDACRYSVHWRESLWKHSQSIEWFQLYCFLCSFVVTAVPLVAGVSLCEQQGLRIRRISLHRSSMLAPWMHCNPWGVCHW